MEKIIVRNFIYPSVFGSVNNDIFSDQYAFRPSGSTTAALISILHDVTNMLLSNDYVYIIGLDFSKAFDTVRHGKLMEKMAKIQIGDDTYNWIENFLDGRKHCTRAGSEMSEPITINASVIQGSGIGPFAFSVMASDLKPVTEGNKMKKYADDTYVLVPSRNTNSIQRELENVKIWATENNLKLNEKKSQYMVVTKTRKKSYVNDPKEIEGIEKVISMKILGVVVMSNLSMQEHIDSLRTGGNQSLYALKILKANGLDDKELSKVCRATLISKLVYAAPAWFGFLTKEQLGAINAIVKKAKRWGLYDKGADELEEIVDKAEGGLFQKILKDEYHVLAPLLTPIKQGPYNLRMRGHNRCLPVKSAVTESNYILRMLFKYC